jgi:DUF4097 and DUF4098 domain-containing protein YvlB
LLCNGLFAKLSARQSMVRDLAAQTINGKIRVRAPQLV